MISNKTKNKVIQYLDEYIQKSNAYILFYWAMFKTRKWYTPKKRPYELKELWSKMPKHWLAEYHYENNALNNVLIDLIIEKCLT